MAEVNAVNSWAHARGTKDNTGLDFTRKLAVKFLENNIDHKLVHRYPIIGQGAKGQSVSISAREGEHGLVNRPFY
jgi:hypothetical protein